MVCKRLATPALNLKKNCKSEQISLETFEESKKVVF